MGWLELSRALVAKLCPGCGERMAALGLRALRLGPETPADVLKALTLADPTLRTDLAHAVTVAKQGNVDALIDWAGSVGFTGCVDALTGREGITDPEKVCGWLKGQAEKAAAPTRVAKVIREVDGQYCVYTADGSRQLGCHGTKAEAEAQLAAIEANKRRWCLKAINDEQRLAVAWANVMVTSDGRPLAQYGVDGFNDIFPVEVVEKAAHQFVFDLGNAVLDEVTHLVKAAIADGRSMRDLANDIQDLTAEGNGRVGLMHEVAGVGSVVESLVWTAEKAAALGVPADALPQGWLVTLKIHDDGVWQAIKDGRLSMLSIQGEAAREPAQVAA